MHRCNFLHFYVTAALRKSYGSHSDAFTYTAMSLMLMWYVCRGQVSITGEWVAWSAKVPQVEVETHKVGAPDVVIPTIDTVRHEALLSTWLFEHKPMVLCGPPGSGKTMTLFSALRALPDLEVTGVICHRRRMIILYGKHDDVWSLVRILILIRYW